MNSAIPYTLLGEELISLRVKLKGEFGKKLLVTCNSCVEKRLLMELDGDSQLDSFRKKLGMNKGFSRLRTFLDLLSLFSEICRSLSASMN